MRGRLVLVSRCRFAAVDGVGSPELGTDDFAMHDICDCHACCLIDSVVAQFSINGRAPLAHDLALAALARAIGSRSSSCLDAHYFASRWSIPDQQRFLLAPDGSTPLATERIASLVNADRSAEDAAFELIDATLAAGAPDNVRVLVLDVTVTE